jgi:hypothetical protein
MMSVVLDNLLKCTALWIKILNKMQLFEILSVILGIDYFVNDKKFRFVANSDECKNHYRWGNLIDAMFADGLAFPGRYQI